MNPDRLKRDLIRREELRLKPYLCSNGHWTIAVGWNMDSRPLPVEMAAYLKAHGCISEDMAIELLEIAIRDVVADCRELFPRFDSFSDLRQEALVDVLFNMGEAKVRRQFPTFVHNVNIGDWQGAADELKYRDGKKKDRLSDYWVQLQGDPEGQDDGRLERPEEIYLKLVNG